LPTRCSTRAGAARATSPSSRIEQARRLDRALRHADDATESARGKLVLVEHTNASAPVGELGGEELAHGGDEATRREPIRRQVGPVFGNVLAVRERHAEAVRVVDVGLGGGEKVLLVRAAIHQRAATRRSLVELIETQLKLFAQHRRLRADALERKQRRRSVARQYNTLGLARRARHNSAQQQRCIGGRRANMTCKELCNQRTHSMSMLNFKQLFVHAVHHSKIIDRLVN
jgi:hypothetical protein